MNILGLAIPALLALILATLMVTFQAFKASKTNPAVGLRHQKNKRSYAI